MKIVFVCMFMHVYVTYIYIYHEKCLQTQMPQTPSAFPASYSFKYFDLYFDH